MSVLRKKLFLSIRLDQDLADRIDDVLRRFPNDFSSASALARNAINRLLLTISGDDVISIESVFRLSDNDLNKEDKNDG